MCFDCKCERLQSCESARENLSKYSSPSGVSLEASHSRYTTVYVVSNFPLTAGSSALIFTQTLAKDKSDCHLR